MIFNAIKTEDYLRRVNEGVVDDDQPDIYDEQPLLIWWGVRSEGGRLELIGPEVGWYADGQFHVDPDLGIPVDDVTAVMPLGDWEGFR